MSSGAPQVQPQSLGNADFDRKSPLEKLATVRKVTDPRFGDIAILHNPTGREFVASQELKYTDQKSAGAAVLAARARLLLRHPNLVALLDYSVAKHSELCSTFYILRLFYEYPKSDLKKESLDRERQGQMFSGDELKLFFSQLSSSLDYLHESGRFHGDVQPLLVGFNKDQAATRLIDRPDIVSADKLRTVHRNRFVKGDNLYVTPATFTSLASGKSDYPVDPIKEDSYGLGLTILELGNQRSVQDVYDRTNKRVNQGVLQGHIVEFHRRYADRPELVDAVVGLTSLDEENRVLSAQVTQFLVNGTNLHTVITTKIEALPMDGISLFDNIDTNLGVYPGEPEPLPEKKEAEGPNDPAGQTELSASGVDPEAKDQDTENSGKQIINLDDFKNSSQKVAVAAPPANRPSHIVTTSATTYYYTTPSNRMVMSPYAPVANGSPAKVVYSLPPEQPRGSAYVTTSPKIATSQVTHVLATPPELSGLRLVRTYEDPTNATQK